MDGGARSIPAARYDGVAAWFDRELATTAIGLAGRAMAQRLLGPGPERLLDVGCGGGSRAVMLALRWRR
jgi:ubiquinone/menaquinone biosynthesis C-methylase UbiE